MSKPSKTKRVASDTTTDNIRSLVRFCAETGHIWLHEHRMLLLHAESVGAMRKEIVDMLGMERARGLLLRMGYASGLRDAELFGSQIKGDDQEAFLTGTRLHTVEGIVKVTTLKLEVDRATGRYYGEYLWENSWEGQWHRKYYGIGSEPACWSQIGYATGYTTALMGRPILYKEVECTGMGGAVCRSIGKPVEEWDDASDYERYFDRESIAEQLIDLQTQVVQLRCAINEKEKLPGDIVGNSRAFRAAYGLLSQAAQDSEITVLLQGETGVGKEVFARSLHDMGSRRNAPFIAINCAAIPHDLVESELFGVEKGAYTGALASRPGRFERADGGTLFLDEIGDLPPSAQAKLLRVLQEGEIERLGGQKVRKIDVRLVAASNIDLRQLVKEGKFRSDLYYRLNAFQINIPPLRERKEDVLLLAERFLEKYAAVRGKRLRGFTDKAKRALLAYHWPGNVREMQNMVERGVILAPNGSSIEVDQVFSSYSDDASDSLEFGLDRNGSPRMDRSNRDENLYDSVLNGMVSLDEAEALLIQGAVERARGNLSAAARTLGLTRPQLAYRLARLDHERAAGNEKQ